MIEVNEVNEDELDDDDDDDVITVKVSQVDIDLRKSCA